MPNPKLLIITLLLFSGRMLGQGNTIHPESSDTASAAAILDFLKNPGTASPDSLLLLVRQGARKAKGHHGLTGRLKEEEAFILYQQDDLKGGLEALGLAENFYLKASDSLAWASNQVNQGLMYAYLGQEDQALVHYLEAATYFDRINRPNARLFNNLAILYRKRNDYEQAIRLYKRSLAMKTLIHDTLGQAATHQNLGLLFSHQAQLDSALFHLRQARAFYQHLNHPQGTLEATTALGGIFLNTAHWEEAKTAYREALDMLKLTPQSNEKQNIYYGLGKIAQQDENWEEAIAYLSTALEIARKASRKEDIQILLAELAGCHFAFGQSREAYLFLMESMTRKDSLTEERRQALAEEMEARFEVQQAEALQKEQATHFAQKERQGKLILGLTFSLLAGAIAAGVWFVRANRLLQNQQQLLSNALSEKDAVMQEMHHRVKNNLQFLSSLLSLQAREPEAEAAREVLLQSRSRVLSMALVHQHLYEDSGLTAIRMDTYLRKIVNEVMGSLRPPGQEIDLQLELDPLVLDVDQAVPVALVTHEAVVNACKYAFPNKNNGSLQISLRASDGEALLDISDSGSGPDNNAREGFGQRLMHMLAERLLGTLQISRQPGVRVRLAFPISPPAYET